MSLLLIAESGGSKTDWRLIEKGVVKDSFGTSGLHPDTWNETTWHELAQVLKERTEIRNTILRFYGAGCFNEVKRSSMAVKFAEIGFMDVTVLSDLHAAGQALYNEGSGWTAIMGTGSVLFYYSQGEIEEIIGGKGHLSGDEGSGYYFGKLIIEDYLSGAMSQKLSELLEDQIGKETLTRMNIEDKAVIAALSTVLQPYSSDFKGYHEENFSLFFRNHLKGINRIKSIGIVGSYAFYHQNILRSVIPSYSVEIQNIIEKPINFLVEQIITEN